MTDKPSSLWGMKLDYTSFVEEFTNFPSSVDYIPPVYSGFDLAKPGKDTTTCNVSGSLGTTFDSKQMTATLSKMLMEKQRLIQETLLLPQRYAPNRHINYADLPPLNPVTFRQQFFGDPYAFPEEHRVQAGKNIVYLMYNPVTHAREAVRGLNKYDYERNGWIVENTIDATKVCDVCFGVGMTFVVMPNPQLSPIQSKPPRETCWHCEGTGIDPTKDQSDV